MEDVMSLISDRRIEDAYYGRKEITERIPQLREVSLDHALSGQLPIGEEGDNDEGGVIFEIALLSRQPEPQIPYFERKIHARAIMTPTIIFLLNTTPNQTSNFCF